VTFRSHLTLLLLLNYLLVVGAGLVERPRRAIDRPFDYVHSHDCQLQNVLRVACFDDCNGTQYTVEKKGERLPLQHVLSSLKSLDSHCLPDSRAELTAPVYFSSAVRPGAHAAAAPTGYQGRIELPPRRG
jgi:hypothetical protein